MGMVLSETTRAVQETTASARSGILFGTNPGTIPGEFLRNSFQFKGFALSLMMQQAQVVQMLGPYRGAAYAAQFFVGMTLFGAAGIRSAGRRVGGECGSTCRYRWSPYE